MPLCHRPSCCLQCDDECLASGSAIAACDHASGGVLLAFPGANPEIAPGGAMGCAPYSAVSSLNLPGAVSDAAASGLLERANRLFGDDGP